MAMRGDTELRGDEGTKLRPGGWTSEEDSQLRKFCLKNHAYAIKRKKVSLAGRSDGAIAKRLSYLRQEFVANCAFPKLTKEKVTRIVLSEAAALVCAGETLEDGVSISFYSYFLPSNDPTVAKELKRRRKNAFNFFLGRSSCITNCIFCGSCFSAQDTGKLIVCQSCSHPCFEICLGISIGKGIGVKILIFAPKGTLLFQYFESPMDAFKEPNIDQVASFALTQISPSSAIRTIAFEHCVGDIYDVASKDVVYRPRIHGYARLCSHACQGSKELNMVLKDHKKGQALVAIRDIEAGEELCWDYGSIVQEGDKRTPCGCSNQGYHFIETVNGSHYD